MIYTKYQCQEKSSLFGLKGIKRISFVELIESGDSVMTIVNTGLWVPYSSECQRYDTFSSRVFLIIVFYAFISVSTNIRLAVYKLVSL